MRSLADCPADTISYRSAARGRQSSRQPPRHSAAPILPSASPYSSYATPLCPSMSATASLRVRSRASPLTCSTGPAIQRPTRTCWSTSAPVCSRPHSQVNHSPARTLHSAHTPSLLRSLLLLLSLGLEPVLLLRLDGLAVLVHRVVDHRRVFPHKARTLGA